MFENKLTSNGIHYSRYIASWIKIQCGRDIFGDRFVEFLENEGLPENEVREIRNMAENGKMELEVKIKLLYKRNI